jgi:hypothetical protein
LRRSASGVTEEAEVCRADERSESGGLTDCYGPVKLPTPVGGFSGFLSHAQPLAIHELSLIDRSRNSAHQVVGDSFVTESTQWMHLIEFKVFDIKFVTPNN